MNSYFLAKNKSVITCIHVETVAQVLLKCIRWNVRQKRVRCQKRLALRWRKCSGRPVLASEDWPRRACLQVLDKWIRTILEPLQFVTFMSSSTAESAEEDSSSATSIEGSEENFLKSISEKQRCSVFELVCRNCGTERAWRSSEKKIESLTVYVPKPVSNQNGYEIT